MKTKGVGSIRPVKTIIPNSWQLVLILEREDKTEKKEQRQRVFTGSEEQARQVLERFKLKTENEFGLRVEKAKLQKNRKAVKNSWQLVLDFGYCPIKKKRRQETRHFRTLQGDVWEKLA